MDTITAEAGGEWSEDLALELQSSSINGRSCVWKDVSLSLTVMLQTQLRRVKWPGISILVMFVRKSKENV